MQLLVTMPTGTTIAIRARATDTIETVKDKIKEKEGIPSDHQQLTQASRHLANEQTLRDYNILTGATLHLATTPAP